MTASTLTSPLRLTDEQLEAYHRDGYVVVEGLVPLEEVESLCTRLREYTHDGRALGSIRVQIEPRIQRGELKVNHPGDGIRKVDGLVQGDELVPDVSAGAGIAKGARGGVGQLERLHQHADVLGPLLEVGGGFAQ